MTIFNCLNPEIFVIVGDEAVRERGSLNKKSMTETVAKI